MKLYSILTLSLCFLLTQRVSFAQAAKPVSSKQTTKATTTVKSTPAKPKTVSKIDSFSYALGYMQGVYFAKQKLAINIEDFKQGYLEANTPQAQMNEMVANGLIQKTFMARQQELVTQEKEKGKKFLEQMKQKPGVKELQPDLLYEVIKDTVSVKPADTSRVKVHYQGTLIDGKEFDNSRKNGPDPITFAANEVIKGWTTVLTQMNVGSIWKVYMSSDWGYGDRGASNVIPPGATLIFTIELVGIEAKK